VEVKWDPLDLFSVHAFLFGRWVECRYSKNHRRPIDKDKIEKSEELLRESQINAAAKKEGYSAIARVLESEQKEQMEKRIHRALENEIKESPKETESLADEDIDFWNIDIPLSTEM